jgi:hypothetical protein
VKLIPRKRTERVEGWLSEMVSWAIREQISRDTQLNFSALVYPITEGIDIETIFLEYGRETRVVTPPRFAESLYFRGSSRGTI